MKNTLINRKRKSIVCTITNILFLSIMITTIYAKEDIRIKFDDRKWKVGYEIDKYDEALTEYVLEKESVENWTEMISIRISRNLVKKVPPEIMIEVLKQSSEKITPKNEWNTISKSDEEILYEWSVKNNSQIPDQYCIGRAIMKENRIYFIAYEVKTNNLSKQNQDKWIDIIKAIQISEKEIKIKEGVAAKIYKDVSKNDPNRNKILVIRSILWSVINKAYPDFEKQNVSDVGTMATWVEDKLKTYPDDSILLLYYSDILLELKEYAKSMEYTEMVTELESPLENLLYQVKSSCYRNTGQTQLAKEYFFKINIIEDDPELWRYKGVLFINDGEKEKAISEWELLLKKFPWYSPAILDIGIEYTKMKKYDKALLYLSSAINEVNLKMTETSNFISREQLLPKISFYKEYAEIMNGNITNCNGFIRSSIEKGLLDNNTLEEMLEKIEVAEKKAEDFPMLVDLYNYLIKRSPEAGRLQCCLADIYMKQNNYDKAIEIYKYIFTNKLYTPENTDYPQVCQRAGNIIAKKFLDGSGISREEQKEMIYYFKECIKYTKNEELKKKLEEYVKSTEKDSLQGNIRHIGQTEAVNLTDYEKAKDVFPYKSKMILLEMMLWVSINNKYADSGAICSGDMNVNFPLLKTWAEDKLKLYPKDPFLLLFYATSLCYTNEYQKSLEAMDKIAAIEFPLDNLMYVNKYKCFTRLNKQKDAEEYFNKLTVIEDDPELWRQRGIKFAKKGDMKKAIIEWQKLIERYPWYSPAMLNMGYAKAEKKQFKEALPYFDNALQNSNLEKTSQNGLIDMKQLEQDILSNKAYAEIMCRNVKNYTNCVKKAVETGLFDITKFMLDYCALNYMSELNEEELNTLEEFYTFLVKNLPDRPDVKYYLIDVYIQKKQIDKAIIIVREIFNKKLITPDSNNYYRLCKKAVEVLERKFMLDKKVSKEEKEEVIFYLQECAKYGGNHTDKEDLNRFIALIRDRRTYPEVSYSGGTRFLNYTDEDLNHPALAEEKRIAEEIKEIMKKEGKPIK